MRNTDKSLTDSIREWNEDGQLYMWAGILAALISWFLIPVFGLVAMFCGYRLHDEQSRTYVGGVIGFTGGLGFFIWLFFLINLII